MVWLLLWLDPGTSTNVTRWCPFPHVLSFLPTSFSRCPSQGGTLAAAGSLLPTPQPQGKHQYSVSPNLPSPQSLRWVTFPSLDPSQWLPDMGHQLIPEARDGWALGKSPKSRKRPFLKGKRVVSTNRRLDTRQAKVKSVYHIPGYELAACRRYYV